LQFSYISEGDENTSHNCIASLSGENKSYSKSFNMSNLTSKFNCYYILYMKTEIINQVNNLSFVKNLSVLVH